MSISGEVAVGAALLKCIGLRCLDFLDEVIVTQWAIGMRQTAGDRINPGCVSIGFLAEPATPVVIHEPTLGTNLQHAWVWFIWRSRHIQSPVIRESGRRSIKRP